MPGARGSPARGTQMVPGERAAGGGRRAGPGTVGISGGRVTPALPPGGWMAWAALSVASRGRGGSLTSGFRGQRGPSASLEPSLRHLSRSPGGREQGWKPPACAPSLSRGTRRAEGEGGWRGGS